MESKLKTCIVAGARPDFVKAAPLIRAIENSEGISYKLVYTGAEDDSDVEQSLFNDLQIKRPGICLGVKGTNLNEITGRVMNEFDRYLEANPADIVLIVNDLASTMAVAIVTKRRGIKLANLVAGTRTFDMNNPKEINRITIDGLSDFLFTAGISNNSIANREGANLSKVYLVGNILLDNLRHMRTALRRPTLMDTLKLTDGNYIVLTINRHALIDDKPKLSALISALLSATGDMPVVAPLREYARTAVEDIRSQLYTRTLCTTSSIGYANFCFLTAHAKGIVTDSDNVAEEATFNGIPCITLNSHIEHIETVNTGTNVLVGENPERLHDAAAAMAAGKWKEAELPDKWDGRTAERIIRILLEKLGSRA